MTDDRRCDYCGVDLRYAGSHYHCVICGERCSLMGHTECLDWLADNQDVASLLRRGAEAYFAEPGD